MEKRQNASRARKKNIRGVYLSVPYEEKDEAKKLGAA
jgi:hypothetical protein